MFSLELGEEVAKITCDCCGKPFKSVCGFIKRDDWAYSVYFATLQTGHEHISMGLTVSLGKWWDDSEDSIAQREWVYLVVWPSEDGSGFEMRIDDPDSSRHATATFLGHKLLPEQARESPLREDFFAVADFVLENDPAVRSYLYGQEINISGSICKH
jgi:hypothetical protein